MSLTDKSIKALKPRSQRYDVSDGNSNGLRVRVQPNGRKVFTVVFRSKSGKFIRETLGAYGLLDLATARRRAEKIRRSDFLNDGPKLTFEAAVEKFLRLYSERRNRPSTIEGNRRLLHKHFMPVWAERDVRTITKKDVVRVLDELARDAPSSADHALSVVRKLFYWLETRGDIERCPASRLPKYGTNKPRDRVLTLAEIAAVWKAADGEGYPFGWATQLLLLTGQRPSEVVELPWSEFVVDETRSPLATTTPELATEFTHWHLPAQRAKNKIPNLIPLTTNANALIEKIRARHHEIGIRSPFLFPNERELLRPMLATTQKRERIRKAAKVTHWTLHDLRRTVRTGLAKLKVPAEVAERLMNHVPSIVRRTYDLHSYEPEKLDALRKWEGYLKPILDEGRGPKSTEDRKSHARSMDSAGQIPSTGDAVTDHAPNSAG
jgi:integrase